MTKVRTGQAPEGLSREQFGARFRLMFYDPAFDHERDAIGRLERIAWDGYENARKAPRTAKAGAGFADPDHELSIEWRETRDRLLAAAARWKDPAGPSRVLLVCASPRNDGTCPGEQSKTHRLTKIAEQVLHEAGVECDLLDEAKALELQGWPYPKHLAGRAYGVIVHGDVAGIEGVRRALSDWLDWMGLIDAGAGARLDRFIGYYRPYATSHDELDRDLDVQEEVRNVARAVANAVAELRAGRLSAPDRQLKRPRPK